jgi:hypothetical protein
VRTSRGQTPLPALLLSSGRSRGQPLAMAPALQQKKAPGSLPVSDPRNAPKRLCTNWPCNQSQCNL